MSWGKVKTDSCSGLGGSSPPAEHTQPGGVQLPLAPSICLPHCICRTYFPRLKAEVGMGNTALSGEYIMEQRLVLGFNVQCKKGHDYFLKKADAKAQRDKQVHVWLKAEPGLPSHVQCDFSFLLLNPSACPKMDGTSYHLSLCMTNAVS